jgi:hypothetical protein
LKREKKMSREGKIKRNYVSMRKVVPSLTSNER